MWPTEINTQKKLSHVMRKPVFRVSDQVGHKLTVQPQGMATALKIRFRKLRDCAI